MLSGTLAQIGIAEQMGFLNGIRNALLVSAVLCLIGMIPSAMRGKEHAAPKVASGS
jgi:hypothetical protein